jgi:CubicO group peptidase (beta-lactamase class C family)
MPDLQHLEERLQPLFRQNFQENGDLGAAISLWHRAEPLLDLAGGFVDAQRAAPWTPATLVLIWSATKGLSSACLLHALQQQNLSLVLPVAEVWPEFAAAGKQKITLAQLLSHQAGLSALDQEVDILDYNAVIRALEHQAPLWPPGEGHGYHARTFGFLVEEALRRITGKKLGEYWRTHFAEPLALDLWIGLPLEEHSRVATVYAARNGPPPANPDFYRELANPHTLAARTFSSPRGLRSVSGMNKPEIRQISIASLGGIGNASSLAKFYGMLANGGEAGGHRFFREATLAWMKETLTDGIDRVFGIPTAFSAGFMKDSQATSRRIFGPSPEAFGHPGAGGSHAFADPENALSFAYVMNQMEQTVLPNSKSLRLVEALYGL